MTKDRRAPMRLWTIQTIPAWQGLQSTGLLRADAAMVEEGWLPAYLWLATQMQQRIGQPPDDCKLPIWAWLQWQGASKRRPDLRYGGHLARKTKGVLIEIEINASDMLLSDFELWHYVLNSWYLPTSEAEGEAFDKQLSKSAPGCHRTKLLSEQYRRQMEESWLRIFDLDWHAEGIAVQRHDKAIQATLWQIRLEQVRKYREFVSR